MVHLCVGLVKGFLVGLPGSALLVQGHTNNLQGTPASTLEGNGASADRGAQRKKWVGAI